MSNLKLNASVPNLRISHLPTVPQGEQRAYEYSEFARIWAEGTDEEVATRGGEHSAKGWAEYMVAEWAKKLDISQGTAKANLNVVTDADGNITFEEKASGYWGGITGDIEDQEDLQTALDGRAKTDLSNINASQSAKSEIVGWGMPDYSAEISYSNDTTIHTAPSRGFVSLNVSNQIFFKINGKTMASCFASSIYRNMINSIFPVEKDDTFQITGTSVNDAYTPFFFKFFPVKAGV